MMKFEDFLMQPHDQQRRRIALKDEVEELQATLNGELRLSSVLQYALRKPVLSCPCLSSLLPLQVQALLAELAMVEEEITWLETKIHKLKKSLYKEKKLNGKRETQPRELGLMQLPCRQHKEEPKDSLSSDSGTQSRSSTRSKGNQNLVEWNC